MFALTPDWNGWDGRSRLIQAAWDALVVKDVYELSLKDFATVAGLSPSLFHRHFANKSALFGEVASAGLATLLVNLSGEDEPAGLANAWIRFAQERPRHYGLMFSSEFAEHDGVSLRHDALGKRLRELAEQRLGRVPLKAETYAVFAMIHGAASLVASGLPRQPVHALVQAIDAYLASIR
jgi:AcrR family transcriptional regulator